MATQPTPNPNGNPFDVPLDSEVQESQQRQQASQTASPSSNPFDEPLASEVAEQKHRAAVASNGEAVPNARIRNMTVDPTKDVHSAGGALLSGVKTGAELSAIPASAIGLGEAAPIVAHLAEHLPNLYKAYKILKGVGAAGSITEGATYTLQHLKDVLKILGGGKEK